jgi:hypothetical protein
MIPEYRGEAMNQPRVWIKDMGYFPVAEKRWRDDKTVHVIYYDKAGYLMHVYFPDTVGNFLESSTGKYDQHGK